jgi:Zn-dependent M28 family amino/carboxypeptidase
LDSVAAGPGINDNGSGVALILEMALQVARQGITPDNQTRFAFWGGEELGLLGSLDYIFGMSDTDHANIMANLNFDMVASPNPVRMIYDGDGSAFGEPGPAGSSGIESIFASWFDANGQAYRETPFDGRSDYGPFIWTGIPAGGLFTGAEQEMTGGESETFGGEAGTAYDACYHQACDTIENLDLDVLDEMGGAASAAVMQLGFFSGSMGSDGPLAPPRRQSRAHALPDWIPSACAAHERIWRR